MKKIIAITILFILIISVSGCLEKDMCKELEKELKNNNAICTCEKTDFIPEEHQDLPIKSTCNCMCYTGNEWINITVAEPIETEEFNPASQP